MQKAKDIQYFFYSQAFVDGLRVAAVILLPALIGSYTGHLDIGLTLSLGAMCVSLTDSPGPVIHKKNGMLFCVAFAFMVALLTAFARLNVYTMGLEIVLVTFFFSMFTVYGNRASGVGNAAILVMILTMDSPVAPNQALPHATLILIGGLIYLTTSLLFHTIRPYRNSERALGECIREIATYLSVKADFYDTSKPLDENYKKLIAQQIVVNEKQDAVRELFFKTRLIVKESTNTGRRLVFTFVETVDLFEDITAAFYDYDLLRKQFGHTEALHLINQSLKKIVIELEHTGFAIQTGSTFKKGFDYDAEIRQLKSRIDLIAEKEPANKLVLHKIIVNIRNLLSDLINIEQYFEAEVKQKKASLDHSHFISHQSLDPKIFWNNLSLPSSSFRYAVRVSVGCIVGFIMAKMLAYGHHSYWILMTIAFMLKPAFSLTKQRNIQRVVGTLAGGALGVLILVLIPNQTVHFVFMVLFMIGTYSFMRINYLAMVICITPYVLILFSLLGAGYKDVIQERVLDTLIGCGIAFLASYLLFPRWESEQLKTYMAGILKANAAYMQKVLEALSGHKVSVLEYKLARKDVYLNSANLSAAFQRMLSEPKSKQSNETQVHQFVVLNHILFSNIATIATILLAKETRVYPQELIQLASKSYWKLMDSCKQFEEDVTLFLPKNEPVQISEVILTGDDALMKEQLNFIYTVSNDIDKISHTLMG
jgi:uncharacterized membrane protein (TIGR01666 family)